MYGPNLLVRNILLWLRFTAVDSRANSDPLDAPNVPTKFSVTFKAGIPVKLDVEGGETYTNSVELFKKLNEIAGVNGVGRVDIVESRYLTIPAAILDLVLTISQALSD